MQATVMAVGRMSHASRMLCTTKMREVVASWQVDVCCKFFARYGDTRIKQSKNRQKWRMTVSHDDIGELYVYRLEGELLLVRRCGVSFPDIFEGENTLFKVRVSETGTCRCKSLRRQGADRRTVMANVTSTVGKALLESTGYHRPLLTKEQVAIVGIGGLLDIPLL